MRNKPLTGVTEVEWCALGKQRVLYARNSKLFSDALDGSCLGDKQIFRSMWEADKEIPLGDDESYALIRFRISNNPDTDVKGFIEICKTQGGVVRVCTFVELLMGRSLCVFGNHSNVLAVSDTGKIVLNGGVDKEDYHLENNDTPIKLKNYCTNWLMVVAKKVSLPLQHLDRWIWICRLPWFSG